MQRRSTRLFKSGGSLAVRIPKAWLSATDRVILTKNGATITITPERSPLISLAKQFEEEGPVEFSRPPQPMMPPARAFE